LFQSAVALAEMIGGEMGPRLENDVAVVVVVVVGLIAVV
jgi:hypothetical protein